MRRSIDGLSILVNESMETLLSWNVNLPSVLNRSFIEEPMDSLIKFL